MSDVIYLARANGQVIGKFSEEELRAKIAAGNVLPTDQYLPEGAPTWKDAMDFPGAKFPATFSRAAMEPPQQSTFGLTSIESHAAGDMSGAKESLRLWKIMLMTFGGLALLILILLLEAKTHVFSGVVGVAVGLLALTLIVCWIAFPIIVLSKFNELLKIEREAKQARAEFAKTLKWMVDNWRKP